MAKVLKNLSLCTLTYNDSNLMDELLLSLLSWNFMPSEIVIVDDGSDCPYFIKDKIKNNFSNININLIHHKNNLGVTQSKKDAIDNCSHDIILHLDCDIRLQPDWLSKNLPLLEKDRIGLVSSPIINCAGDSLPARYMRIFSNHEYAASEVEFITGGVWLLKKHVWENIGGFGDYKQRTKQDHILSKRLRRANYKLFCQHKTTAFQVRNISRLAIVLRHWEWVGSKEKELILDERSFFVAVSSFVYKLVERIEIILKIKQIDLIYIELLYTLYSFLALIDHAEDKNFIPKYSYEEGLWVVIYKKFYIFENLYASLNHDLCKLGQAPQNITDVDSRYTAPWEDIFEVFSPLEAQFFSVLEKNMQNIMQEGQKKSDFSFYENPL